MNAIRVIQITQIRGVGDRGVGGDIRVGFIGLGEDEAVDYFFQEAGIGGVLGEKLGGAVVEGSERVGEDCGSDFGRGVERISGLGVGIIGRREVEEIAEEEHVESGGGGVDRPLCGGGGAGPEEVGGAIGSGEDGPIGGVEGEVTGEGGGVVG